MKRVFPPSEGAVVVVSPDGVPGYCGYNFSMSKLSWPEKKQT